MTESFKPRAPLPNPQTSKAQLQQRCHRFPNPFRRSSPVISTAISGDGIIVTVTASTIRLHDSKRRTQNHMVEWFSEFTIEAESDEEIQAVAISDDLVAAVTRFRLLVFAYRQDGSLRKNGMEPVPINQNDSWTPSSVAIIQVDSAASIAVGGQGVNGVKLFQYFRNDRWNLEQSPKILRCPNNISSIRLVGFSLFVRQNGFYCFAVTSNDRIFGWHVFPYESVSLVIEPDWNPRGRLRKDAASGQAEIASVSVFESPQDRRPFMFYAMTQRCGSRMRQSFVRSLESVRRDLNIAEENKGFLPDEATGRDVYAATISPSGRYIVVVKKGAIKLLTLRGGGEGLACLNKWTLEHASSLRGAADGNPRVCLSVCENLSSLTVTAVDGWGHILDAEFRIKDTPRLTSLSSESEPAEVDAKSVCFELPNSRPVCHEANSGTELE